MLSNFTFLVSTKEAECTERKREKKSSLATVKPVLRRLPIILRLHARIGRKLK